MSETLVFNPQLRAQLIPQHERFRALTAKTSLKVNSKHHGTANEVLNIIAMLMCVDNPDPKMLSQAKTFVYNRVRQGKNLNEIMRWFGVGALVPLVDWRWRTQLSLIVTGNLTEGLQAALASEGRIPSIFTLLEHAVVRPIVRGEPVTQTFQVASVSDRSMKKAGQTKASNLRMLFHGALTSIGGTEQHLPTTFQGDLAYEGFESSDQFHGPLLLESLGDTVDGMDLDDRDDQMEDGEEGEEGDMDAENTAAMLEDETWTG